MHKQVPTAAKSPYYRGRFAPTPSGPLHFGSLVAALASYLDAKAHGGEWLVRIEDVDKSRAVTGADSVILEQLEQHHLFWDATVIYQSQRDERYADIIAGLDHHSYSCDCSRRQIRARGPCYDGHCRLRQPRSTPYAIRFKNDTPITHFDDRWLGGITPDSDCVKEDFILRRRDHLFAYQLAVVVDDIEQGITDIVRGEDLLQPSFWQLTLWQHFAKSQPRMMHVPLAINDTGRKLSKQNHAPPIDSANAVNNLAKAAVHLGLAPIEAVNADDLLKKATVLWRKKWRIDDN